MENTMGPPLPPGYSLRVMLFGGQAHREGSRPLRCFRVVSSPDVTVHDFCREASRIHEINYGGTIGIKKVQDDQEFDITQSELLGNVFQNLDTIRIIQAVSHPGIRDSLPPTSALRFTSGASRKRVREESVQLDDSVPVTSFNTNKKQRLSDLDPDHPLPSREITTNGRRLSVIHDSQDSDDAEASNGAQNDMRHVRHPLPRTIPGTPSPPPTSSRKNTSKNGSADHRGAQADNESPNREFSLLEHINQSTPSRDLPQRGQSHASHPPRAKNASYHISRPSERGASVSTAATSPNSAEQQGLPQIETADSIEQSQAEPILPASTATRSQKEQSSTDEVASDEGSTVSKTKKAALKRKGNTGNGLPVTNGARKFSTPPSATQQRPGSRGSATTSGEIPLTPSSKQRKEKVLQNDQNTKAPGMAAKEAAEKRQREADARRVEEARLAAEEQEKQEELERVDAEQQAEAKRKAARVKKAEEALEKRKAKEKAIEAEAEAQRLRDADEERDRKASEERAKKADEEREEKAAEAERMKRIQEEASRARLPSSSPRTPVSTPILPPRRASGSRGQSGTPLIPPRKSALKNLVSSSAVRSSSPSGPSNSPERTTNGVGIETQLPLPKSNRRVSFKGDEHRESPVPLPTRRMLPPASTPTSTPQGITPKESVEKSTEMPVAKTPAVTSIVPPPKRYSLGATATPISAPKATPGAKSKLGNVVAAKATSAKATPAKASSASKSASPSAQVTPVPLPVSRTRKSETAVPLPMPRASQSKKKETPVGPILPPPSSQSKKRTSTGAACDSCKKQKKRCIHTMSEPRVHEQMSPSNSNSSKDRSKSISAEPVKSRASPLVEPSAEVNKLDKENAKEVSTRAEAKFDSAPTAPGDLEVEETGSESSSDDEVVEEKSSASENAEEMDMDEDATQSHHTSSSEASRSPSRSPISFFREASPEEKRKELVSPTPDASEDEDEDEDEEMMDVADQNAKAVNHSPQSPTIKRSKADQMSLYSSESESENEEVKARVPESSPPVRAVRTPETKPINARLNNSKETERSSTQDQVDQQLTSSMYEVRSSLPHSNTPTPKATSNTKTRPPAIGFGASLNRLHEKRSSISAFSQVQSAVNRNGQLAAKLAQAGEDEESESSDDPSDNESSSDSDQVIPATAKAPIATQSGVAGDWASSPTGTSKSKMPEDETDADNDSSENDGSDGDENETEEERKKARARLAAMAANVSSSQSSNDKKPSPKKSPFGTQQGRTPKAKAKTYGKGADKYLSGMTFSQPR